MNKVSSIEQVKDRLEPFNGATHFLQENSPLYIRFWAFKNLEGRLLTLVESMGLGDKQEEAVKGYMRREVWDTINQGYVMSKEAQDYLERAFCGEANQPENLAINVPVTDVLPKA